MLAGRCLYSLLGTGFERWDAVILVLAGSNAASAPYLTQLSRLDLVAEGGRQPMPNKSLVLIPVVDSNIDLHGYAALHKYRDHPLVRADGYLYVLDSVTFDFKFPTMLDSFNFHDNPRVVYTSPLPASNIAAFGAGVVRAYGSTFEQHVGKRGGLLIEHNAGAVGGVRSLASWGEVVFCPARSFVRMRLRYHVAEEETRLSAFYPSFGLYKHIKWGDPADTLPEATASECTRWTCGNLGLIRDHSGLSCPRDEQGFKLEEKGRPSEAVKCCHALALNSRTLSSRKDYPQCSHAKKPAACYYWAIKAWCRTSRSDQMLTRISKESMDDCLQGEALPLQDEAQRPSRVTKPKKK